MILHSKDSQESSATPQIKIINSSVLSFLYSPTLTSIHDYWKNYSFEKMGLCWKVVSLIFNMLSSLVIAFLQRNKHLLISWLQSPSAVILEPPKIKSDTVSTVSPSISHDWTASKIVRCQGPSPLDPGKFEGETE